MKVAWESHSEMGRTVDWAQSSSASAPCTSGPASSWVLFVVASPKYKWTVTLLHLLTDAKLAIT